MLSREFFLAMLLFTECIFAVIILYRLLQIYSYVATSKSVIETTHFSVYCRTPFIVIGRTHCTYKSFYSSLRPRQCLESQVMGVWTENANKVTKQSWGKSAKELKKYVFSCYLTVSSATSFPF